MARTRVSDQNSWPDASRPSLPSKLRAASSSTRKLVARSLATAPIPPDAVPAASQLNATTSNLVGLLGASSDEVSAAIPIFNRSEIPMFGDTGQSVFNKSSFTYFYRTTRTDDVTGYAMALYAKDKGYKRAVAVFGNDISSEGLLPTVTVGIMHLGIKIEQPRASVRGDGHEDQLAQRETV